VLVRGQQAVSECECLHSRLPEPTSAVGITLMKMVAAYAVPYGDVHDTFSSDYSPSALDSNGWTQSESSVSQSLSHDDSVSSIVAHGAEVGSSRAPHFDGANR
jgi:hypothetical protein